MTEKESTGKSTKVARPSKKQAKKKRRIWPWVVLAFLLVFVALPAGLFAYAYSQYTVPEPKDLAKTKSPPFTRAITRPSSPVWCRRKATVPT